MSKALRKMRFYDREGVTNMKVEEAKRWEGKQAKVHLVQGEAYQGKITEVCNEYCDKWIIYFDGDVEIELDEVDSIAE